MRLILIIQISFCLIVHAFGQHLDVSRGVNITTGPGDDLFPVWSKDGQNILFQTKRNGSWDIYRYSVQKDSSVALVATEADEQHPVYFERESKIVFDSDHNGSQSLYYMDLSSGSRSLLFDRGIACRQAVFTSTEKLVYFTGYDEIERQWQIYSFEFYYENLNRLTSGSWDDQVPAVSPDEDRVIFIRDAGEYPPGRLHLMNWYGEDEAPVMEIHASEPSWDPSGLKIYFISRHENRKGDLYSCWFDGSHLERITRGEYELRTPSVSPDGRFIAISVRQDDGFDIFLVPFEEY